MNRRLFLTRLTMSAYGLWVPSVAFAQRARRLGGGVRWSATATAFNGSSWLYRGAFVGAAATKSLTLSVWFNIASTGADQHLFSIGPTTSVARQQVRIRSTDQVGVVVTDSSGSPKAVWTSAASYTGAWHHLYASLDLAGAITTLRGVHIDGASAAGTWSVWADSVLQVEAPYVGIGAIHNGSSPITGSLAELVYYPGSGFRDPAAYIGAFYSGGKPVDLGANGSKPWGVVPIYYGHGQLMADTSGNSQTLTAGGTPVPTTPP